MEQSTANFRKLMNSKGWTLQVHSFPIKGKDLCIYHKEGSELTEDEAEEIFHMGFDMGFDFASFPIRDSVLKEKETNRGKIK